MGAIPTVWFAQSDPIGLLERQNRALPTIATLYLDLGEAGGELCSQECAQLFHVPAGLESNTSLYAQHPNAGKRALSICVRFERVSDCRKQPQGQLEAV